MGEQGNYISLVMNNSSSTRFTSICLKTVGVILVASSLLDFVSLAIPFNPLDAQWQRVFTSQIVDRGIVPMVGMAIILVAYWIESTLGSSRQSGFDLKFPAFVLSIFFGLLFLILVPLHLNNLRLASSDVLTQLEQQISQAKMQLANEYQQLNQIVKNPQSLSQLDARIKELDTAIAQKQIQGEKLTSQQIKGLSDTKTQLESFSQLAKNPQAFEQRIKELQTQLKQEKSANESRTKTEVLKQGIRTSLNSLMLAVGYLMMGWIGLKSPEETKASSSGKRASA